MHQHSLLTYLLRCVPYDTITPPRTLYLLLLMLFCVFNPAHLKTPNSPDPGFSTIGVSTLQCERQHVTLR